LGVLSFRGFSDKEQREEFFVAIWVGIKENVFEDGKNFGDVVLLGGLEVGEDWGVVGDERFDVGDGCSELGT